MLTTVSIGPERPQALRENTTGPARTPQTLRVCYRPGCGLRTWEPGPLGPVPGLESSPSSGGLVAGRGVTVTSSKSWGLKGHKGEAWGGVGWGGAWC